MRVRDHLALSTAGAALLYPALGNAALVPWAASLLIDADHYLWFCIHERTLNPARAVRFFNQAQPPQHMGTRLLHSPIALALLVALALAWHPASLVLLGVAFHVALDLYHAARLAPARRATLRRDGSACRQCGARAPDVVAHVWRQPRLLPSYRIEHFASVCGACHELAHARRGWRPPSAVPAPTLRQIPGAPARDDARAAPPGIVSDIPEETSSWRDRALSR